jgi:hypothetical protein
MKPSKQSSRKRPSSTAALRAAGKQPVALSLPIEAVAEIAAAAAIEGRHVSAFIVHHGLPHVMREVARLRQQFPDEFQP